MCIKISTSLKNSTNHDIVIDIELNTNTPAKTTTRSNV